MSLLEICSFCRPFLSVLQMLVNADVNVAKDTVLYLHSIFRAIRMVEDAANIEISPVRACSNDFFLIPLDFIIKQFYQLQGCFFLFLFPILEVAHIGGHRTLFCNFSKLFWSFLVRCSKAYFAASIFIQSKFSKEN